MFHYFVSRVALQLHDISVVMRAANSSVTNGTGVKWLCGSGAVSEFLFSFRNSLFLKICKLKRLSAFCMQSNNLHY